MRQSRWSVDWRLSDAKVEMVERVVEGWTGSAPGTGKEFVEAAKRNAPCSEFPRFYEDVRAFFQRALEAVEKGGYKCPRCFDLDCVIKFGSCCCGETYCTDIVNTKFKNCPCSHEDTKEAEESGGSSNESE